MDFILSINIILLIFIIVSVSIIFIMKSNINDLSQKVKLIEKMLFDEFTRSRNENMLNHKDLREEVTKNIIKMINNLSSVTKKLILKSMTYENKTNK